MRILFLSLLTLVASCSKSVKYDPRKIIIVDEISLPQDGPVSYFEVEKELITPALPVQNNTITFYAKDQNGQPVSSLNPQLTITPKTGPVQNCNMTENNQGVYSCVVAIGEDYSIDISNGSLDFFTNRHIADVVITDSPYCYQQNRMAWTSHKASGTGTSLDPYLICTAQQLKSLATTLNSLDLEYHYQLMINLNLANFLMNSLNEFSIANNGVGFTGVLDGNGFEILNYKINDNNSFISVLSGGVIKNLKFSYSGVSTKNVIGGLVSSINNTNNVTISGIEISGTTSCFVLNSCSAGGLVGEINLTGNGNVIIENINNVANISNAENIGGLVGKVVSSSASRITLNKIYSHATLNSSSPILNAGGLVGLARSIDASNIEVNVLSTLSEADYVGSVFGRTNETILSNTLSRGQIFVHSVRGLGGLVGSAEVGASVVDSVSFVNLTTESCFEECGKVIGSQLAGGLNISNLSTTATTLFDVNFISPATENITHFQLGSLSDFYFKTVSPFDLWDFDNIWTENNSNVPSLR